MADRIKWIKRFEPLTSEKLLNASLETAGWIEKYNTIENDLECWEVLPGRKIDDNALLLKDTSLYAGAAGIALFYLRLYVATQDESWLKKAKNGINYCINRYKGKQDFSTDAEYLQGAYIGFLNGPAGGAYVSHLLYKETREEKYKDFALRVADDLIETAREENGEIFWYGFYGILGEGSLILFLLEMYEFYKIDKYLETAHKASKYIAEKKEESPWGGYRWNVMPSETFPTIGKPGGYFPGFEYGAAGSGYILAKAYEYTKDDRLLEIAQKAAEYILNIADYSSDGESALVRYNDTYLTDLYYLGVCQGPIGTSRLFYELYKITENDKYKQFVIQLTNGILSAGAPLRHSEGYWRTNCYCCGAAGMLEHFINIHRLTGDNKYLNAAYDAAEAIIGESTVNQKLRCWYTSWNRHEPESSDAYIGLYHGSSGCASALLTFRQYLDKKESLPPYLEDAYNN